MIINLLSTSLPCEMPSLREAFKNLSVNVFKDADSGSKNANKFFQHLLYLTALNFPALARRGLISNDALNQTALTFSLENEMNIDFKYLNVITAKTLHGQFFYSVHGTLYDWQVFIIMNSKGSVSEDKAKVANQLQLCLENLGLGFLFSDYTKVQRDGYFKLKEKA